MADENESGPLHGNDSAERSAPPVEINIPGPRKRGRPKGSGKGSAKSSSETSASPSSSPRAPSVDPVYIVSTLVMLFELADDYMRSRLVLKLRRYLPEKEKEFGEVLDKQAFNEKDREMLRHTLSALVAKYDILAAIGPEVGLIVFLGQYSFRMMSLNNLVESFKPKQVVQAAPKNESET